jgi:uncharacterized RDD family membrane protein YckC
MRVHIKPHYQPVEELALDDVKAQLEAGRFDGRELAWVPGLSEWTTLDRIPGIARPKPPPLPTTPPPLVGLPELAQPQLVFQEPPSPKQQFLPDRFEPSEITSWRIFFLAAHPQAWRRFWGRLIDVGMARICLEITALVLLLTTGFWPPYETQPIPAFIGTFVVWVIFLMLYEALMLSTFGTTIGKLFFRIRVLRSDNSLLSFGEAFFRAKGAIGSGMFYLIAFPGLTFVAVYRAYKELVAQGRASWDTAVGSVVRCRPVFVLVYAFGVVLAISALLGYIVVREYAKQEFRRITVQRTPDR